MKGQWVFLGAAACAAGVASAGIVDPQPFSGSVQDLGGTPHGVPIYSDTAAASFTGYYNPAGAGVESADDLHMAGPGAPVIGFDMAYFAPNATASATVTFYDNPG